MNVTTNEDLRRKLEEAEDLIHAIRHDRVDGFVVDHPNRQRVLMLQAPDRPYRILIEKMQPGRSRDVGRRHRALLQP